MDAIGIKKMNNGRYQSRYGSKYLGTFDSFLEAVMARDKERIKKESEKKPKMKPMHNLSFGERLNEAIWRTHLGDSEICRRANISRSQLWQYRYQAVEPRLAVLAKLSKVLGVTTDWLLGVD